MPIGMITAVFLFICLLSGVSSHSRKDDYSEYSDFDDFFDDDYDEDDDDFNEDA